MFNVIQQIKQLTQGKRVVLHIDLPARSRRDEIIPVTVYH